MRICMLFCIVAVLVVSVGCAKKTVAPGPSDQYISRVIECLDHTGSILPDMAAPADAAAKRWASGGHVYMSDDETISRTGAETVKMIPGGGVNYPMSEDWGGFVAEACDRAGGFRHVTPVPVDMKVTKNDVVLAGTIDLHPEEQIAYLTKLKQSGALIILFGSKSSKVASTADFLIDNGLPSGIVPVMNAGKDSTLIGPVAPMANLVNMWTFTAELIAAMNRQGKMPTLWQSMFVPGAAPRNTRIEKMEFDPDAKITKVEPGVLGRQFVTATRSYLAQIKATELDKFVKAGILCADTHASGKKIVASIIGHFMVTQTRMPGFPDIFTIEPNEYGRDYLKDKLGKGDLLLHVGYSYTPVEELKFAREVGAKTVAVFTPGPTTVGEGTPVPADTTLTDVYIDPYWKHGDAVVEVPGYDVKVIPPSGVVMITCYWMIIGETMRSLAGRK
jgi:uncharacterized phosphosugar-binding protein